MTRYGDATALRVGRWKLDAIRRDVTGDPAALIAVSDEYRRQASHAGGANSEVEQRATESERFWTGDAGGAFRSSTVKMRERLWGVTQSQLIEMAICVEQAARAVKRAQDQMADVIGRYEVATSVFLGRAAQSPPWSPFAVDRNISYFVGRGEEIRGDLHNELTEVTRRLNEVRGAIESGALWTPFGDDRAAGATQGDIVRRALRGDASPAEFRAAMDMLAQRLEAIRQTRSEGRTPSAADLSFVSSFVGSLDRADIRSLHGYISAAEHGSVLFGLIGGEPGFDAATQQRMTRDIGNAFVLLLNERQAPGVLTEIVEGSPVSTTVDGFSANAGLDGRRIDGASSGITSVLPFLEEATILPTKEVSKQFSDLAAEAVTTASTVRTYESAVPEVKDVAVRAAAFAARNEEFALTALTNAEQAEKSLAPLLRFGPATAGDTELLRNYFTAAQHAPDNPVPGHPSAQQATFSLVRLLADPDGMAERTMDLARNHGAAPVFAEAIAPHMTDLGANKDPAVMPADTYHRFLKTATATSEGYQIVFNQAVRDVDTQIEAVTQELANARTEAQEIKAYGALDQKFGAVASEVAAVAGASAGTNQDFIREAVERANAEARGESTVVGTSQKTIASGIGEAIKSGVDVVKTDTRAKVVVTMLSTLVGNATGSPEQQVVPQAVDPRAGAPADLGRAYAATDTLLEAHYKRYRELTGDDAIDSRIEQNTYLVERNALAARMSLAYQQASETAIIATTKWVAR